MSEITADAIRSTDTPAGDEEAPAGIGPGPLAPYRFALSLGFAGAVAGPSIAAAVQTGAGLDGALLRALGAAAVMWFPTGLINRLLTSPPSDP